ncbi:MAG: methylmalonyl-CoA mutase family protein, partial [Acidimicrobiales bacterium]
SGEQRVVGLNCFETAEPSPLEAAGAGGTIVTVDPSVEADMRDDVARWREGRSAAGVRAALDELRRVAASGENVMPASIALAHSGGTTGEWATALREIFGEHRAPTGVAGGLGRRGAELEEAASRVRRLAAEGGPPRLLVAKPGLDGHSNGAEQVAVAARDAGFEVVYDGIRLSPAAIAAAARDEDVDVIGLSILSGAHVSLAGEVISELSALGVDAPVVVGGIIPERDRPVLIGAGVRAVFTPKDYALGAILAELAELVAERRSGTAAAPP